MNNNLCKTARALAAAALLASLAFAPATVLAAKDSGEARAEARIKDMHAKLRITAVQEAQWGKVADVMRDNAKAMETLTNSRHLNAKNMTAVDDLKSYGEITDAHADGIKRLTPVFELLYADMSDAQKKRADEMFRHRGKAKSK
jgi:acyl-coenzyme A synthetase/AMP-(fatty) acid ligase